MSNKHRSAPVGATLVLLSSFFYATYGIWTKLTGDFFGGYTASAWRSLFALIILVPIAIYWRQLEPIRIKKNWPYALGLFVATLFVWGPLYYAILHAGIGISIAIMYASLVIGSFVFGWMFGREQFTKEKAISAAIGMVGIGLIFSPATGNLEWLALFAALISGLCAGATTVFSKQIHYKATQSTIALWTASTLANFVMAIAVKESQPSFGLNAQWLYLVFFAIASVIASWLLIKGVKLIDAGTAGVLGLSEIVFGILFGVIFFHERPGPVVLLGIAVIMTATAIPYIKDYRQTQKSTLPPTLT